MTTDQMTTTIPQTLINAMTGESHIIQLKPRKGLTAEDVRAFLADREEEAKRIDPENCEVIKYHTEVLDPYGLFDVPDERSCVGSERFARNLPDGSWVWFDDLPKATQDTLLKRAAAK
jgi:hypothetical protein